MEIRFDESEVIVVDLGSGFIKAGYSGEDVPRVVIPTVLAEKVDENSDDSGPGNDSQTKKVVSRKMGNDAYTCRDTHTLFDPIKRGEIHNWDHLSTLLEHLFYNELGVEPRNATVLMTDSLKSTQKDKQDLAAMMFDTFRFKAFALQSSAALSLFSSGKTTGLVAESGEGLTYTVPVFEGYALPHAMQVLPVAGQDITNKLLEELQDANLPVTASHFHYIRDIKEKMCHVPMHYETELERRDDELTEEERSYELPGGVIVEVNQRRRVTAAECIFRPSLVGVHQVEEYNCDGGIARLAVKSIEKVDSDLKVNLYNNVVLAGGTTLMKNFYERFTTELRQMCGETAKTEISVTAALHRKNAAWVGGSMLASFNTFHGMTIRQQEYSETTPDTEKAACILKRTIY